MRLTWDSENRLKQVNNNSHDARYLYDSGGQRILKRGNRTEIVYPTQFIQLDRAKKLYTKHIFVGTTRISSKLCSITNYFKDIEFEKRNNYTYHPDHLGSTSFVSDFQGKIYEYYQYTPYGEIWAEKSDILDKITHLFSSKELDAESGFYYFGARYLEPMTSRWLSPDPIFDGLKEGYSIYAYCRNNPLKYHDPTGLLTENGIIENGDTLSQISKDHNTTVEEIIKVNPQIKDRDKIYQGDHLNLPQEWSTDYSQLLPQNQNEPDLDQNVKNGNGLYYSVKNERKTNNPIFYSRPFTIQFGITASGGAAVGFTTEHGIAFEFSDMYGFRAANYHTVGFGNIIGYGLSIGLGVTLSLNYLEDLSGWGYTVGGSIPTRMPGISLGIDGNFSLTGAEPALSFNFSWGKGTPEFHHFVTYTWINLLGDK